MRKGRGPGRHTGARLSGLAGHYVRCPSCAVWYRCTQRKAPGLWCMPHHTVPGLNGALVVYANGKRCHHSSWCRDSGHVVLDRGLRRPASHREETSHAS